MLVQIKYICTALRTFIFNKKGRMNIEIVTKNGIIGLKDQIVAEIKRNVA
jgi:hypothetical protein